MGFSCIAFFKSLVIMLHPLVKTDLELNPSFGLSAFGKAKHSQFKVYITDNLIPTVPLEPEIKEYRQIFNRI